MILKFQKIKNKLNPKYYAFCEENAVKLTYEQSFSKKKTKISNIIRIINHNVYNR